MAMMRYGSAEIVEPSISSDQWTKSVCCGHKSCSCGTEKGCRTKVAKTILAKYAPEKYLLSHATIVASVDVEEAKESKSDYKDYLIKPAFSKLVNNNGDAWTKDLLAQTYRTFIGADNYTEHVQIKELSKGKVIDAALREVPIGKDSLGKDIISYYVDILVATDRKHKDLVRRIEAGEVDKMSMGCFLAGTEITMSDGIKRPIEELKPGDMVVTHTGNVQPILNIQKKWYIGKVLELEIEGNYKNTMVTPEHPFWAFKRERICACGCGEKIGTFISGHKDYSEEGHPVFSRYKRGHYARIVNPNSRVCSFEDYKKLKEQNLIRESLNLSWEVAGDLKERDVVSYPVSKRIVQSVDATIDKARLIGYFLAEGSFVKEVVVTGEENDYGVRCKICGGIYNILGTHLPVHKISMKEYASLYPGSSFKAKIRKKLIRTKSRKDDLGISGLFRERKRIGVEFSLGEHEYETLNKEIYDTALRVFPKASVLRYKNAVKIMGVDIADFFFKYCGEYAEGKVLPEDVLFWEPSIQKHLVATWVLGDYSTTISKKWSDQLRFLLYRLRIIHNTYYVAESLYKTDVKKRIINGEDIVTHYEGTRSASYMFQLNAQAYGELYKELNHSFEHRLPKRLEERTVRGIEKGFNTWKNSHSLDSMVKIIQKIKDFFYEGWVYNFEVAGDNSYIANDMAVHNCKIAYSICSKCGNRAVDETQACDHVKYEKNNVFYDESGTQRKIAELCGHASEPDSVIFMDASWVKTPAFTGAVVRSAVNPPENVMAKIKQAESMKTYEFGEYDFLKAASKKAQDAPKEDTPPAEPSDTGAPAAEEPPADTGDTGTPPADTGDAGAPPPPAPEKPEINVKTIKDQIKQNILEQISDEITQEFSGGTEEERPTELETLDENIIQPTASQTLKQLWTTKKGWDAYLQKRYGSLEIESFRKLKTEAYMLLTSKDHKVLADYGYNKRDFLAVMSCVSRLFKSPLSRDVVASIAQIGTSKNLGFKQACFALQKNAGRKLEAQELSKALTWLKMMDAFVD